eukprot:scaffold15216_cov101-Skeletonema_dohrnii-CCMP3373.AAC.2
MQLITLCFGLISVAQAASTSTYSSILTAAETTFSVAVANASQKTGFCTGGRTYCGIFSGSDTNPCPSPYCQLEGNSCNPAKTYVGNGEFVEAKAVPCSVLTEVECNFSNAAKTPYVSDYCNYVNQGTTDSVLIAFTTISVFLLLVITIVVCRRLPLPKKYWIGNCNDPATLGRREFI